MMSSSLTSSGMRSSRSLEQIARPKQNPAELADVLDLEDKARRRYAAASRMLMRTARNTSREVLQASRVSRAKAVREEQDMATGKDLKEKLREVPVASEQELQEISCRLNAAVALRWPESRGQSTFFKLFRFMDSDDSGLISYMELLQMIREQLRLTPEKLPTSSIQGLWRSLDEDESGTICAGEFLTMMRKGYLLRMKGLVSGDLAVSVKRPPWSPSISVAHTDRGTPDEERKKNMEELRRASAAKAQELEEQAAEFERRAEEAMRLAERVRPKEAKFVPRRKKPLEKTVTGKIREEVAKLQERDTDATRAPRSAAAGAYLDARGGPGS